MTFPIGMVKIFRFGIVIFLPRQSSKEPSGFTLLEVLLVTLILVVITGVTVPNFSPVWKNLLLKQAVQDLAYHIRYAQSRSVTHNLRHRIQIESDGFEYWLAREESADEEGKETEWVRLEGRYGRTQRFAEEFDVETRFDWIEFLPDGAISPFELQACSRGACYSVSTLGQRGRVHVYELENE